MIGGDLDERIRMGAELEDRIKMGLLDEVNSISLHRVKMKSLSQDGERTYQKLRRSHRRYRGHNNLPNKLLRK